MCLQLRLSQVLAAAAAQLCTFSGVSSLVPDLLLRETRTNSLTSLGIGGFLLNAVPPT